MTTDLQSALQAAERMQRYDAGEDPLTIWPEMRGWCERQSLGGTDHKIRYFGTEAFVSGDQEILADAYLAILRNPAEHVEELLAPFRWECKVDNQWTTDREDYEVCLSADSRWAWFRGGFHKGTCDSLESAKSACWLDFVERVKVMFRKGE